MSRWRRISRRAAPLALVPALASGLAVLLLAGDRAPAEPRPPAAPVRPRGPEPRSVTLADGRVVPGELVREGRGYAVIRRPDGRVVLEHAPARDAARPAGGAGARHRVRLVAGRELEGELLGVSERTLELRLASGARVTLLLTDVAELAPQER